MNLGQCIAKILLEAEDEEQRTIALFPGAFKPPHKGHYDVVQKLTQMADEVVILISPKSREGITAEESYAAWELYLSAMDSSNIEVKITEESPIKEVYNVVKENPRTNFVLAFGKGEIERFKSVSKFPNIKIFDAGTIEGTSATGLRMALVSKNESDIEKYLPSGIAVVDFLNAIGEKSGLETPEEEPENVQQTEPNQPEGPLKESGGLAPLEYDSPYHDYVLSQMDKIEKASEIFNLPIEDIQYAFEIGHEVVLTDSIWSKLENTKSYQVKSLKDAIKIAQSHKVNIQPYINAIKNKKQLPLPLVMSYGDGKYYLIGGEIELSLYKALNLQPIALLAVLNLKKMSGTISSALHEENDIASMKLKDEQIDVVRQFIKYAVKSLDLQNLPSNLTLSYNTSKARHLHTFGYFDPTTNAIWLYVKDRNVADILRTLAHELVHRKQEEEGRIDNNSGQTGSSIENEANAMAGILLRNFGKHHEEIYE